MMRPLVKKIRKTNGLIVASIILLVVSLYLLDGLMLPDTFIYDSFYEGVDDANTPIIIVGIDDLTYEKLGRWPYTRELQSNIFKTILAGNPAVLGIDVLYDAPVSETEDAYLVEALLDEPIVLAMGELDLKSSLASQESYMMPFDALAADHNVGYINPSIDSDGVVRRIALAKESDNTIANSFAYEIYKTYLNQTQGILPSDESLTSKKYIDYMGPSGSIKVVSAYEVQMNLLPSEIFENKIVLFGPYTVGMQDDYVTPIDKLNRTFGIEIHGNIINNLLNDSFKVDLNTYIELMMILLFGLISYGFSQYLPIKFSILAQGILVILLLLLGKIIYWAGYVSHIFYPIISAILISLAMLVVGYIKEELEKRRITNIFGRYVATQIVDEILETGEENLSLGGKRKDITILFVDIRGFTPLSEVAEPEEVVQILNDYLELCTDAVFDNKGTLDKFIGDAAMAIYNAPLELENHPYHAVKTAWDMKVNGAKLAIALEEKFNKKVQFGIGVNTGKAVVGNIGSKVRMDYTAIGDAVNTAARLESNAKPGQILISDATYQQVKDYVKVTNLGAMKVKGKSQEIEVYQVDDVYNL